MSQAGDIYESGRNPEKEQAYSHTVYSVRQTIPAGSKAAALLISIWGAPSNTLQSRSGHAEPRRGTECWGEDLLITFGWADAFAGKP
ncbi:hypothetical protein TU75_18035 [Pseudomonas poae]|uniref:Uncharacterized protein n=1 Tax=Pseudomonas poae TaxID=200451 RepID=A0ABY0S010_9PSED|nr:hypothetical protein TU75_18035 [Pseudomonas poae]SDO66835.1 hypothetical protein SAMN04490208_4536 [Pseudomonas poae]